MNDNFKTKPFMVVIITFLLITAGQTIYSFTDAIGSKEDPIVTLSYLELKIEQLKDYIDQKAFLSDSSQPTDPTNEGTSATYEVVELKKGQKLIAGGGTEIILRSGTASAIISPLGGLSDITGAKDIGQGEKIAANHLLIIPRDDGRGLEALADSFLLVRGDYRLE